MKPAIDTTGGGRRRLKRAAELFVIDEWGSDSGFVDKAWTSRSEPEPFFISVAASHWQIVVTTQRDRTQLTVRGPETRATVTAIPADAEFFGIVFSLGTFVPAMPLAGLVDRAVTLPAATPSSVWLDGSRWEIPTPGNADVFVDRLVRRGPGRPRPGRRRRRSTATSTASRRGRSSAVWLGRPGSTRRTIRQIARAEQAVEALDAACTSPRRGAALGYADQAHLIRSLQRFIGQTTSRHRLVELVPDDRLS